MRSTTGELVEADGFLVIPASGTPLTDDVVRELIDADRPPTLAHGKPQEALDVPNDLIQ